MNFLADQALYIYGFESQISFELRLPCLTTPGGGARGRPCWRL